MVQDISADDLKVFLEEAESLIDLLDEDFIRLEQEADNQDLIQEIFRAAHTLKGSSGMLGFTAMAGLTHQMEDLLDRVRKGTVAVTAEIVDALLMSLDGLKVMRDHLRRGDDIEIDVAPLVEALRDAVAGATPAQAEQQRTTLGMVLQQADARARLDDALARDATHVHHIVVQLEPSSDWLSVRCFQILNEIDGAGTLLASAPTRQEIEQEHASGTLHVLVDSARGADDLRTRVLSVVDVLDVTVQPWDEARLADAPPAAVPAAATPTARAATDVADVPSPRIETVQSVRIDVDRLDQLMNLVGELVIDRTRVSQLARTLTSAYKEDEQIAILSETAAHISRVVDELHESMMQVRMLPVGIIFSKFPRLVRDLARATGKQVNFVVEGEGTEIDRSVIEKLKDPLVHMIRNAVDHGLETPEERVAAGKPETGTVRLAAVHGQGHILITLEDDGHGIDAQAIRESAVRKGVITQDVADRMSDRDVLQLIFAPGFSTAKQTTEVSGRGVGMDVVRRDIESINGNVELSTAVGKGTKFTLRLPLTLATFGGLLVESGNQLFAIPLMYTQETVRPEPRQLETVATRPVMRLRDSVMPLIRLNEAVRHEDPRSVGASRDEHLFAVVVRAGDGENDRPVAIGVNALVDQQEIVVKPLSGMVGRTQGISGASILGDGRVVLIVDVPTLIKGALQSGADGVADERRSGWVAA